MKNRLGSQRGNAMIEFALASGVLIPLLLGTFQFGYSFYIYNLLATQMRSGARYASMKEFKGSDVSGFKTAVKNMIMYGNPDGTGNLIEPGLAASQLDVEIKGADGTTDASSTVVPVTVSVSTVNYSIDAAVAKLNLNGKPMVTFSYLGE